MRLEFGKTSTKSRHDDAVREVRLEDPNPRRVLAAIEGTGEYRGKDVLGEDRRQ
jgi:hypothetical protein